MLPQKGPRPFCFHGALYSFAVHLFLACDNLLPMPPWDMFSQGCGQQLRRLSFLSPWASAAVSRSAVCVPEIRHALPPSLSTFSHKFGVASKQYPPDSVVFPTLSTMLLEFVASSLANRTTENLLVVNSENITVHHTARRISCAIGPPRARYAEAHCGPTILWPYRVGSKSGHFGMAEGAMLA